MTSIKVISQDAKSWPFIEAKKILKKIEPQNKSLIRLQTGYGPRDQHHVHIFLLFQLLSDAPIPAQLSSW